MDKDRWACGQQEWSKSLELASPGLIRPDAHARSNGRRPVGSYDGRTHRHQQPVVARIRHNTEGAERRLVVERRKVFAAAAGGNHGELVSCQIVVSKVTSIPTFRQRRYIACHRDMRRRGHLPQAGRFPPRGARQPRHWSGRYRRPNRFPRNSILREHRRRARHRARYRHPSAVYVPPVSIYGRLIHSTPEMLPGRVMRPAACERHPHQLDAILRHSPLTKPQGRDTTCPPSTTGLYSQARPFNGVDKSSKQVLRFQGRPSGVLALLPASSAANRSRRFSRSAITASRPY